MSTRDSWRSTTNSWEYLHGGFARRFEVPGGFLYQVKTEYLTTVDTGPGHPAENETVTTGWSQPVFVPYTLV